MPAPEKNLKTQYKNILSPPTPNAEPQPLLAPNLDETSLSQPSAPPAEMANYPTREDQERALAELNTRLNPAPAAPGRFDPLWRALAHIAPALAGGFAAYHSPDDPGGYSTEEKQKQRLFRAFGSALITDALASTAGRIINPKSPFGLTTLAWDWEDKKAREAANAPLGLPPPPDDLPFPPPEYMTAQNEPPSPPPSR